MYGSRRRSTRLATSVRVTHDVVTRPTKRLKVTAATEATSEDATVANSPAKATRKLTEHRKEEPKPEEYRTRISSPWKVGVHVSAAGGVENAIQNAAELG
jgi:AP endonuclease 1